MKGMAAPPPESEQTGGPGSDEQVAIGILQDAFHIIVGHPPLFAVGIYQPGIAFLIGMECFLLVIKICQTSICAYPYPTIFCGIQIIDDALGVFWQTESLELTRTLIHAGKSVSGSQPKTGVLVLCDALDIIVGKNVGSVGIRLVSLRGISVV